MGHTIRLLIFSAVIMLPAIPSGADVLGSDWHDDPDGDGILTAADLCPWVYDPAQLDDDLDGLGNPCDPDFAPPVNGGPITDLRIEHVTPYGAWLSFTSPHSTQWGWDVTVAWSTDPAELTTFSGFSAAYDRGDATLPSLDVEAGFGEALMDPVKIISLEPGTTYYAAATRVNWDGLDQAIGNLVTWQTEPDPTPTDVTTRPRVLASAAQITAAQNRRAGGDSRWWTWENLMQPVVNQAATDPPSVYLARHYCSAGALLYLASGDPADLSDAEALLQENITYWQDNDLTANLYRWENSELAVCTDLLWNHLDLATRNTAVAAFLEEDETHISEGTPRYGDTDEFASITRNWILHGLTACSSTGIDPSLATRGCAVLDAGLRLWHGVQLVKARRDRGFWAQSGGFLPDGSDYGQGTSPYWMQTFLALHNNGYAATPYADFVSNNLVSMVLQLFSPSQLGFATAGDVEDFSFNWLVEANSFQLEEADAGLLTLHAAVLESASFAEEAAWARYAASELYEDQESPDGFYRLLLEADNNAETDHRQELASCHLDSGLGILFDRSSWSSDASHLLSRAGWNGVDHSHGDIGHFQLFRRGRWITHEAIGYDGTAADGIGHNVLLLQVPDEGSPGTPGQSRFATSRNRLIRVSSGEHHSAFTADITGAYSSFREPERYYSNVQRSLVWLKTDELGSPDVMLLRDYINRSPSAPAGLVSRWQLHIDENPTINGRRADVALTAPTIDQQLAIDVLLPADASLTVIEPEGPPDGYPAQIYTHRLMVDTAADVTERVFLTVLQAADSPATAPPTPVTVDSTGFEGALVGSDLVLINKTAQTLDGGGALSLNVGITTTDALRVFVLGMDPDNLFEVAADQNGATLSINIVLGAAIAADSGGMLAFMIDGARSVTPLYAQGGIFRDDFETGDLSAWSINKSY